jgi:hypothetical protein
MSDEVSEEDCVVCGQWPAADREGMRGLIERIPLEGACPACEVEFWGRLGLFEVFGRPTKH